jgi:hypothetical protein
MLLIISGIFLLNLLCFTISKLIKKKIHLENSCVIIMNSEPDKQGHNFGPDSNETYEAVNIFIFFTFNS